MKRIGTIILICLFFSCEDNMSQDQTYSYVQKTFYPNGKLKSIQRNISDSNLTGDYKSYYANGQLELEVGVVQGKRHGEALSYFENGNLRTRHFYENDVVVGNGYTYYETGENFVYNYYNDRGEAVYRCEYNEEQCLIAEEGNGVAIVSVNNINFAVDEKYQADVFLVFPPKSTRLLIITVFDTEGNEISRRQKTVNGNIFKDTLKNQVKGSYVINYEMVMGVMNCTKEYRYSFDVSINVK